MAGRSMSRIKFLLMNIFLFIKQQTTFIIKTLKLLLIRPSAFAINGNFDCRAQDFSAGSYLDRCAHDEI